MKRASTSARLLRVCLGMTLFAVSAFAQTTRVASRIVRPIDDSSRTVLRGTTPGAIKGARDLGPLTAGQTLNRMILVLKPSGEQEAALTSLIKELHNRNSAEYHHWLTPDEFAAQFGPSASDLTKVEGWLQSHGLNPMGIARGGQWIEFSGTGQQVEGAFGTTLHRFEVNGQTHIANATDISIPQALTPVVEGVLSLNNFQKQPDHTNVIGLQRNAEGKLAPVSPDLTTTDGNGNYFYYMAPTDFQTIYNEKPLLTKNVNGAGLSIAIVGRSDIYLSDVQTFRSIFGLPANDPNIILNGTDPGYPNFGSDLTESTLDVEWAGAAAPGATINLVESASTDTTDGTDLSAAYIVDNDLSPIMSMSYGACEALLGPAENAFYNSLWQQAAAEGITVFVSSGDGGAAECDADLQRAFIEPQGPAQYGPTVNGTASTPYDVAVGGTQFNEAGNYSQYWGANNNAQYGSALGYIPEQVWNQSCDPTLPQVGTNCPYGESFYLLEGGGGGPSSCSQASVDSQGNETCLGGYTKPSWQTGAGVPKDGVRDIPDLSLNASPEDDGYLVCINGDCATQSVNGNPVLTSAGTVGGTSASAPSMAGIMALVEQENGAWQGQADYEFYQLAAMDSSSSCDSSAMTDPTQPSSCNFNDVTLGNNSDPGLTGYGTDTAQWSAGAGYDMASGLGSVNAANLAANWSKISFAGSATTLSASGTTVAHGQPLTLSGAVAATGSSGGIPTGEIVLETDKYGDIATLPLDATGQYSGAVSNLPGGTYNLTARYSGDGTFASSVSAPVAITVSPEDSAVSLNVDVINPSTNGEAPYSGTSAYGSPLYLNVTVKGKSGQGLGTGTVEVLNGSSVIATAPLTSSGTVSISTGNGTGYNFPVGTSAVSVKYSGDNSLNAGVSAAQQIAIQKQQITTNVGISTFQASVGQPVILTASAYALYGGVAPTGTFQFYDNGTALGSPIAIPSSGIPEAIVTYSASFQTAGQHLISVGYSGDSNFAPVSGTDSSVAYPSSFQVIAAGLATTTSITESSPTVAFGQNITYTVKVTPVKPGGAAPTGEVLLSSTGSTFIGGQVNLVNGQGTVITSTGAGTAQVYAQYMGDSTYSGSTSPAITTTVMKYTPAIRFTTAAPDVLPGQQTSLNVVVTGFSYGQFGTLNPSGTVQFFTAVNGAAPQAITAPTLLEPTQPTIDMALSMRAILPTGTNVVTAVYSGDSQFNSVSSMPVTVLVTAPDFTIGSQPTALTVSAGGSTTGTLTVAPVLGFAGAVALSCGSGLPAGATCSFSPSSVAAGGGQSDLTVALQGPFTTQARNEKPGWLAGGEMCGLFGLFVVGLVGRRRKAWAMLLVVAMVAGLGLASGCGGGGVTPTSAVMLTSSQTKVASGTSVTFTAQVSGGSGPYTGTVAFFDGPIELGNPVALSDGEAAFSVSNLAIGTHSITARYSGDSKHSGSDSQPMYQAVTGTTTLQVVAASGSLSHTLSVPLTVQ